MSTEQIGRLGAVGDAARAGPSRSSWTATAAGRRRTGLPVEDGHREGTRALRRTVEAAIDLGVDALVVYAFSTENWSRPPDEVAALMEILGETIDRELPDLARAGCPDAVPRPARPGSRRPARRDGRRSSARPPTSTRSTSGSRSTTAAAPSSSRPRAAASRTGSPPTDVDEAAVAARLYAPELPEIDLLIRTSGEFRISNFMLWETAYAEFVFTDTLWPDFGDDDLRAALAAFAARDRRFGGR